MNKKLLSVALFLLPIAVISFIFKNETNFNLGKMFESSMILDGDIDNDNDISTNFNSDCDDDKNDKSVQEEPIMKVLINNEIIEIPLEEYIVGVVAGEMPASFNIEALKAQAVASRSFALFRKNASKKEYDVTGDTNSQVYINLDAMKKKWGEDFSKYYNKILDVVEATKGEVITYNGKIAEALFSSMSGGITQDVAFVWGSKVDYLVPVESKYDNEDVKGYKSVKTIDIESFKNKLNLSCNDLQINSIERNISNYISKITICNKTFTGDEARWKLGLKSANFEIDISNSVTITTYGYGHGVGMSQYGANGYAEHGYDYKEILKHYYTNIEISNIINV